MSKIYAYARVSTAKQNLQRQIDNIRAFEPNVTKIFQEKYTGTKIDGRAEFNRMKRIVKSGDTIIFDSVSRMSRNAEEGFEQYQEWYDMGIRLVFLNERHIDTDSYKSALNSIGINIDTDGSAAGTMVAEICAALNKFMRTKVEDDIRKAFEQADKEARDIKKRVNEGLAVAKANGTILGRQTGDKLHSKIGDKIIEGITKYSKDFGGMLNDTEVINQLGCSRGAYYKYKNMLIAEQA